MKHTPALGYGPIVKRNITRKSGVQLIRSEPDEIVEEAGKQVVCLDDVKCEVQLVTLRSVLVRDFLKHTVLREAICGVG